MNLKRSKNSPTILELEETTPDSIPFSFENNCNDIVIKIKQKGEKQVFSKSFIFTKDHVYRMVIVEGRMARSSSL